MGCKSSRGGKRTHDERGYHNSVWRVGHRAITCGQTRWACPTYRQATLPLNRWGQGAWPLPALQTPGGQLRANPPGGGSRGLAVLQASDCWLECQRMGFWRGTASHAPSTDDRTLIAGASPVLCFQSNQRDIPSRSAHPTTGPAATKYVTRIERRAVLLSHGRHRPASHRTAIVAEWRLPTCESAWKLDPPELLHNLLIYW
jgi:hypothetical protein